MERQINSKCTSSHPFAKERHHIPFSKMNTLTAFFALAVIVVATRAYPLNNNNLAFAHDVDALTDIESDNQFFGQPYGYNMLNQYAPLLFNQGYSTLNNQGFHTANTPAFNFLNTNFNQRSNGYNYMQHDEIEQPDYYNQYY